MGRNIQGEQSIERTISNSIKHLKPYQQQIVPLMMSILPTLTSALLILGLIGLGVHGLLKK
jgi:hypothetical protein